MSDPHEPASPSWECRDCGHEWPCPSRRQILLDEYRQQSTSLRVYLATCLTSATQDLAASPADLRDRFLGWGRTGCPPEGALPRRASTPRVDAWLREGSCPQAWPLLEAGEHDGYLGRIPAPARDVADEVDVIVLAQASMAPAVRLLSDLRVPVLFSPRSAVARATSPRVADAAGRPHRRPRRP